VNLIVVFFYLNGCCRENGVRSLSEVQKETTGDNNLGLEQGKFQADRRETFASTRVSENWLTLLREDVGSPSSEIFKTCLYIFLSSLI